MTVCSDRTDQKLVRQCYEPTSQLSRFDVAMTDTEGRSMGNEVDVFQVGRCNYPWNDFVVRGPLHENNEGSLTGPVSRFAFRIVCERLEPHNCYLFASGLDKHQELVISPYAPTIASAHRRCSPKAHDSWTDTASADALSFSGVKLYSPDSKNWVEISIGGDAYELRRESGVGGRRLSSDEVARLGRPVNLLMDNSIIEIGGICMLFQSSKTVERQSTVMRSHL